MDKYGEEQDELENEAEMTEIAATQQAADEMEEEEEVDISGGGVNFDID
jgi:hypothetical protein